MLLFFFNYCYFCGTEKSGLRVCQEVPLSLCQGFGSIGCTPDCATGDITLPSFVGDAREGDRSCGPW